MKKLDVNRLHSVRCMKEAEALSLRYIMQYKQRSCVNEYISLLILITQHHTPPSIVICFPELLSLNSCLIENPNDDPKQSHE